VSRKVDDTPINTREAARLLGVKESLLVRWRYERKGPPYLKLGYSTVRYLPSELLKFLVQCRIGEALQTTD
jgi:hypothetical protein